MASCPRVFRVCWRARKNGVLSKVPICDWAGNTRASASPGLMRSGVVPEDATHGAGGQGKKLAAIDPRCTRLFRELQVRLVNHGGGG